MISPNPIDSFWTGCCAWKAKEVVVSLRAPRAKQTGQAGRLETPIWHIGLASLDDRVAKKPVRRHICTELLLFERPICSPSWTHLRPTRVGGRHAILYWWAIKPWF